MRGICAAVILILSSAFVVGWPAPRAAAQPPHLIVISQLKVGNVSAPRLIEIHNSSLENVDITNWCVFYATKTTQAEIICIEALDPTTHIFLPAGGALLLASSQLEIEPHRFIEEGLGNGVNGAVYITNAQQEIVDAVGWGDSPHAEGEAVTMPEGRTIERQKDEGGVYTDTNNNAADFIESSIRDEYPLVDLLMLTDACLNIEGLQEIVPDGLVVNEDGECKELLMPIEITELLPNALGSDIGNEFIEIYNPNTNEIALGDYYLMIGQSLEKKHAFPEGAVVPAQSYLFFTNSDIKFSLRNDHSQVAIFRVNDDSLVGGIIDYMNPDDGMSWAVFDGIWMYTNQPTPGEENRPSFTETETGDVEEEKVEQKSLQQKPLPCPAGKFRNPETNRCKTIVVASLPKPCKEGQERNPETNRCRNIAVATNTPKPCKDGQERNPDTNRCRTVPSMPVDVDYEVLGDIKEEQQTTWPWILAAAMVGVGIVGYGVWEWRQEIRKIISKLLSRFSFLRRQ